MINKKNLPLILALCIPVLMVIFVAGAIYLPGLGKKPKYNFIYASNNDQYYTSFYFYVSGNKLVKNVREQNANTPNYALTKEQLVPVLYFYNVATKEAKEISFEEAQKYNLDASKQSSDGYEVSQGNGGGGDFLFGGGYRDYSSYFLRGHNRAEKLNLKTVTGQYNYYNSFQFLGWVIN